MYLAWLSQSEYWDSYCPKLAFPYNISYIIGIPKKRIVLGLHHKNHLGLRDEALT